jgi:hypothetical protein
MEKISKLNLDILDRVMIMILKEWKEIYLNASIYYEKDSEMVSMFFYYIDELGKPEEGIKFSYRSVEQKNLELEVKKLFLQLGNELKRISPIEVDYINLSLIVNEDSNYKSVIEYEKDDSLNEFERRELWESKYMRKYQNFL